MMTGFSIVTVGMHLKTSGKKASEKVTYVYLPASWEGKSKSDSLRGIGKVDTLSINSPNREYNA